MLANAIADGPDQFALRVEPDGIYLADGRMIPSRYNPAACVDDGQLIVPVHRRVNDGVGLLGTVSGVDIKQ